MKGGFGIVAGWIQSYLKEMRRNEKSGIPAWIRMIDSAMQGMFFVFFQIKVRTAKHTSKDV